MANKFYFSQSWRIAALLTGAGTTAVAGIMLIITIPALLRIAAAVFAAVLFAAAVRRHAFLRGARAVRAVEFFPGGEVEITVNSGVWRGQILSARPSPLLTVFVVGCGKQTFSVMAGGMPPDLHRQLRARLADAPKPPQTKAPWFRVWQKYFPKPAK